MQPVDIYNNLTPAEQRELSRLVAQKRILEARNDLTAFSQLVYPNYYVDAFNRNLDEHLMAAMRRDILRLIVSAPPQTGKSTKISSIFPPFWIGNNPDDPILIASYEADKAAEYSYAARSIVESDIYGQIYPGITTRQDSRARNRWNVVGHAGRMFAAGVDGPLAGRGAMLGIIDDPIKGWKEAVSQTVKDAQWEWYRSVFRARVWERGVIIIVMTRWAEDDLVGRILNSPGARDWTLLRYTGLAESQEERDANNRRLGLEEGLPDILGRPAGQRLTRYSQEYWEELKRDAGSRVWAGLYQGVPRPLEGNLIKRDWFKIIEREAVPYPEKSVRYWDNAGTEGGGAQTAGVLITRSEGKYYVWDVEAGNWSPANRNKVVQSTAAIDSARFAIEDAALRRPIKEMKGYNLTEIWIEKEPGSGGKESSELSIRELAEYPVHADPPSTGKDTRLMPFAAQLEAGNVYLVRAPWNEEYIDQMTAVPNGTLRDMADASAGAFNKLQGGGFALGSVSTRPGSDW